MGFGEQGGDGGGREGVGDDEMAVAVEGGELLGREADGGGRHDGRI